jgi:hypothetical protein
MTGCCRRAGKVVQTFVGRLCRRALTYLSLRWPVVLAVGGYVTAVVLVAAIVIPSRLRALPSESLQYRATRQLPANHCVAADDIAVDPKLAGSLYARLPQREKIDGQYLIRAVARDNAVLNTNLSDWPNLSTDKDHTAFAVPVTDEFIDAGTVVDVCAAEGCPALRVAVVAVVRRKSSSKYAVVAVPTAQINDVEVAAQKRTLQLRLVGF